jgi:hypothetical protein
MLAFAGQRISPRMIRKQNGTLVCVGVPLCRTGIQEYRKSEVTGEPSDELVEVVRSVKEVLDPVSVASYEGVPVCDGHPPMFLTPENWSAYSRGHLQNCRIDTLPSGEKAIIADLVIEDRLLIDKILTDTSRDLSVGYSCAYWPLADGRYEQRTIRANHLAVVPAGRANQGGHRDEVRIFDSALELEQAENFGEQMRRYHRQNILSVSPAPRVRTHQAPVEHIARKVTDIGKKEQNWNELTQELGTLTKLVEEFIAKQSAKGIHRNLADEVRAIARSARQTEALTASRIGPARFHDELRRLNQAYDAYAQDREEGQEYSDACNAVGSKMRGEDYESTLKKFRTCRTVRGR